MRQLLAHEVEWTLEYYPEEVAIEGNASATGQDEADRETEAWIRNELEAGNTWAWAFVVVRAKWQHFEGSDCIGCCSYASEKDFVEGGDYEDLKKNALEQLNEEVRRTASVLLALTK